MSDRLFRVGTPARLLLLERCRSDGAEVQGLTATGSVILECEFHNCMLRAVDLSHARLDRCLFRCCSFHDVDFSSSVFNDVRLVGCTVFGGAVCDAVLRDCLVRGTLLSRTTMHGSSLQNCDFRGLYASSCDLRIAEARASDLAHVIYDGNNLWNDAWPRPEPKIYDADSAFRRLEGGDGRGSVASSPLDGT